MATALALCNGGVLGSLGVGRLHQLLPRFRTVGGEVEGRGGRCPVRIKSCAQARTCQHRGRLQVTQGRGPATEQESRLHNGPREGPATQRSATSLRHAGLVPRAPSGGVAPLPKAWTRPSTWGPGLKRLHHDEPSGGPAHPQPRGGDNDDNGGDGTASTAAMATATGTTSATTVATVAATTTIPAAATATATTSAASTACDRPLSACACARPLPRGRTWRRRRRPWGPGAARRTPGPGTGD